MVFTCGRDFAVISFPVLCFGVFQWPKHFAFPHVSFCGNCLILDLWQDTKIGKMANDLRRKIKNEKQAKRIKQLVRHWKQTLERIPLNGKSLVTHHTPLSHPATPNSTCSMGRVSVVASPRQSAYAKGVHSLPSISPVTVTSLGLQDAVSTSVCATINVNTVNVAKMLSPALPVCKVLSCICPSPTCRLLPSTPFQPSCMSASPSSSFQPVSGHIFTERGMVMSPAVSWSSQSGVNCLVKNNRTQHSCSANVTEDGSGKGRMAVPSNNRSIVVDRCKDVTKRPQVLPLYVGGGSNGCDSVSSPGNGHQEFDASGHRVTEIRGNYVDSTHAGSSLINFQDKVSRTNAVNCKRRRDLSPGVGVVKKRRLHVSGCSTRINGCISKQVQDVPSAAATSRLASVSSQKAMHGDLTSPASKLNGLKGSLHRSSQFVKAHRQAGHHSHTAQSVERLVRDKHRVKTTEQLIEALQRKNSSNIASNLMTKLRTNQIEKECDSGYPVLPPGSEPVVIRSRCCRPDVRIPGDGGSTMLSGAKNDLVERLLNSSSPTCNLDGDAAGKCGDNPGGNRSPPDSLVSGILRHSFVSDFSSCRHDCSNSGVRDKSKLDVEPTLSPSGGGDERTGSALSLEEIYSQLPPIDWGAVELFATTLAYPLSPSDHAPGRWPYVDGLTDGNGDWVAWKDCVTLSSHGDVPLIGLPYVDLAG